MLPFLFLSVGLVLTGGSAIADGEDATARARGLMSSLGMSARMNMESVSRLESSYLSPTPCWWVTLAAERGRMMVVLDAGTGKVIHIVHSVPQSTTPRAGAQARPTREMERRAKSILHTVGYDRDARLSPEVGTGTTVFAYKFYRTINKLSFFNINPTYAHYVHIDRDSGAIEYFLPSKPLPEVNASRPNVKADAAVSTITAWASEHGRAKRAVPSYVGSTVMKPELGYYKVKTESTAQLVWRAVTYLKVGDSMLRQGPSDVFVDALTGAVIEPDDR